MMQLSNSDAIAITIAIKHVIKSLRCKPPHTFTTPHTFHVFNIIPSTLHTLSYIIFNTTHEIFLLFFFGGGGENFPLTYETLNSKHHTHTHTHTHTPNTKQGSFPTKPRDTGAFTPSPIMTTPAICSSPPRTVSIFKCLRTWMLP